jgi:hypothetical protein
MKMNAMDPMGEDLIHDNNVKPNIVNKLQCAYCGLWFLTRNRLFKHLRENGIETGAKRHVQRRVNGITKRKKRMMLDRDMVALMLQDMKLTSPQ